MVCPKKEDSRRAMIAIHDLEFFIITSSVPLKLILGVKCGPAPL
jgi:hypothetical protein